MFWSKIWFFLIAAVAVVAIGAAVALPRPAERQLQAAEDTRLDQAVRLVQRDLALDARHRVDLGLLYSRSELYVPLKKVREDREGAEAIAQQLHDSAKKTLDDLLERTSKLRPQFLIAVDAWGRAVARKGGEEKDWGDDLSGFFLVRDALLGYLRDDLWLLGGKLYRVAAAPVIAQPEQGVESYVGVIVVGHELDEALARTLAQRASTRCGEGTDPAAKVCDTQVAFFARGEVIANSGPTTLATDIKQEFAKRAEQITPDGFLGPFTVTGEGSSYRVVAQRLPGEAGAQDAFFAVYAEVPRGAGLVATLQGLVKQDLGLDTFPWVVLGGGFLAAVLFGMVLMWAEADRPLRRLVDDALALGKGEARSMAEDQHRGKHGSIARSVNLAIDRLSKEKEKTRRDLGALYTTDADSGDVRPLPPSGPLGAAASPFIPPPRSDFALEASDPPVASGSGGFEYQLPPAGYDEAEVMEHPPTGPGAGSISLPDGNGGAAAPGGDRAVLTLAPPAGLRTARTPTGDDLPPLPEPGRRAPLAPVAPPITPARVAPRNRAGAVPAQAALEDDILGQSPEPPPASPSEVPTQRAPSSTSLNLSASLEPVGHDLSSVVAQQATPEGEQAYYQQVFEDFIELKRKCGEATDSLTYEKFVVKLQQNRDTLIARYACKAVKFQVYVKDGKAALKATPVKA